MKQQKFCGNCGRVGFTLTPEELSLITGMYERYHMETVDAWVRSGCIRTVGRNGEIDLEKTQFALLANLRCWCRKEKAYVAATELACYAWKPGACFGPA